MLQGRGIPYLISGPEKHGSPAFWVAGNGLKHKCAAPASPSLSKESTCLHPHFQMPSPPFLPEHPKERGMASEHSILWQNIPQWERLYQQRHIYHWKHFLEVKYLILSSILVIPNGSSQMTKDQRKRNALVRNFTVILEGIREPH